MTREKLKKIENGIEKNQDILENPAKNKYIFLSLGSNLSSIFGSKINNLEIAQLLLISSKIEIIKRSSYYESPSYPNFNHPKFINCILKAKTRLSVHDLINVILKIEKKLGRLRNIKNEPRECDIDIIDYKDKLIIGKNQTRLIIPHKLMHKRPFVLLPLVEIAPNWVHPKFKVNINFLINKLKKSDFNFIKKIQNE